MPFPESPRIIYDKNPLIEVICQLRFPAILKIDSNIPTKFQDTVRNQYPIYRDSSDVKINLSREAAALVLGKDAISMRAGNAAYEFVSADEVWKVSLTREFLALTTSRYETWDDFKAHLDLPRRAFEEDYSPSFYTRIGLRYRNIIDRKDLGIDGVPWSQLLRPHIAGVLDVDRVSDKVTHYIGQITISLEQNLGQVLINHGFVQGPGGEICYMIDSDFSLSGKLEVENAIETLDSFNKKSGKLFRWCITDRLHEAMVPQRAAN